MNREQYLDRLVSTGTRPTGRPTIVPDNVQRLAEHEPCFMCGTRAGLACRHRTVDELVAEGKDAG